MSATATVAEVNPYEFTLGDRMKRALRVAGISRAEIAEYLDVAPETVSTWTSGRIRPSTQTLRLWAMRTGAPYEWLLTGVLYTPRDSNPEPTDSGSVIVGPWLLDLIDEAAA